jgi:hypothetical protein
MAPSTSLTPIARLRAKRGDADVDVMKVRAVIIRFTLLHQGIQYTVHI